MQLTVPSQRFAWVEPSIPKMNIVSRDTDNGRIYTIEDGTGYWSMTTMLGMTEEDTGWYDRWVASKGLEAAEAESKRCCDRGEMIHLAAEMYVRGYPLKDCIAAAGQYRRLFVQLQRALDGKLKSVYGCELPVFSKIMKVGGRLDLCGRWGSDLAIIDYKGSNFIKCESDIESYRHQLCGYSLAIEEMYGIRANKLVNIIANEKSSTPSILVCDRKDVMPSFAKRINKFFGIINAK